MNLTNKTQFSDWIISKNNQFSIINKPFGIPVQKDKTGVKSLQELAEIYFKHPVHLMNRLDRPVGGLVLMAHKKTALEYFSNSLKDGRLTKRYFAIVKGVPEPESATLKGFIKKNSKAKKSFITTANDPDGKECSLDYQLFHKFDNYSVLDIQLNSGRFHQIRAQLSNIHLPIKGDVKYGARRSNRDRSIDLFAYSMEVQHPVTKKKEVYTAPLPNHNGLWDSLKIKGN